ncbi:MAG: GDSL-type esterase/lipase family protein [Ruminococcus sp.]
MNIRKWMALLTGTAMTVCTSSVFSMTHEVYAENAADSYKIMCVGDSITHGYINGDNGYRKYLCYYLAQNGISYDMVGPENNWTDCVEYNWNGTSITYDPAHCGYSGYAIRQYNGRNGIYETMFGNGNVMQTYNPDMVLLQIGTNDLLDARLDIVNNAGDITAELSAVERLEGLVDEIILNMDASDSLFIASVPYIDAEVRSDWLYAYGYILGVDTSNTAQLQDKVNECVDRYNAGVKAIAEKKFAEGKNVHFADINSIVDMKTGLEDGVHPNESGYAEMGKLWANTLSLYLGGDTPSDTTTTEITTTTTETTTDTTTTTIETTTTEPETTTSATETTTFLTSESSVTTETTTVSEEVTTTTTTEQVQENLPGDANGNGSIELADAVLLRKYLLGITENSGIVITNCDMDSNTKVNIFDAVMLLEILTENRM